MKKRKPDNISQEDWDSVESPALTKSILSSMKRLRKNILTCRRVRGSQKEPRKTPISIRLDESIIKAFRASGRGWQSQGNDILRDWLKKHKAA